MESETTMTRYTMTGAALVHIAILAFHAVENVSEQKVIVLKDELYGSNDKCLVIAVWENFRVFF